MKTKTSLHNKKTVEPIKDKGIWEHKEIGGYVIKVSEPIPYPKHCYVDS